MTVDVFIPGPAFTVTGTGPYTIDHPYGAGSIEAWIVTDEGETALAATDYSVFPASAASGGGLTLTPSAAALHAGRTLRILRRTDLEQGWAGATPREKGIEAQLDEIVRAVQEHRAYGIFEGARAGRVDAGGRRIGTVADPVEDADAVPLAYLNQRLVDFVQDYIEIISDALVYIGDDPPPTPVPGTLWGRTSNPVGLYVYYADGDSVQWVAQAAYGPIAQPTADVYSGRPYFASRAAAEAGKTGGAQHIEVGRLSYVYDAAGTALTTGDGRSWSPDGPALVTHWAENTVPGTTDLTAALAAGMTWLAGTGQRLGLPDEPVRFTSTLSIPSGTGLAGRRDGKAELVALASDFTHADPTTRWDVSRTDNCLIRAHGQNSGDFTPLSDVAIEGLALRFQDDRAAARVVQGIWCRNVRDTRVERVRVSGLPVGGGIKLDSLLGRTVVRGNEVTDIANDFDLSGAGGTATNCNLYGIEIDNSRIDPGGTPRATEGAEIEGNTIDGLQHGGAALAWLGSNQSDALGIFDGSGYRVLNNRLANAGEGVDLYAAQVTIAGNWIHDCDQWGIKGTHGASQVAVTGNVVERAGIGCVTLSSGNGARGSTEEWTITGNTLRDVDPTGANAAGQATAVVKLSAGGSPSHFAQRIVVADNVLDPGDFGEWVILEENDAKIRNNAYRANQVVRSGTVGRVRLSSTGNSVATEAQGTALRLTLSAPQSLVAATEATVALDTAAHDAAGEWLTADNRASLRCPGRYQVAGKVKLSAATTLRVRIYAGKDDGTGGAVVYDSGTGHVSARTHDIPAVIVATNNPTADENRSFWLRLEAGANADIETAGTFLSIAGPL